MNMPNTRFGKSRRPSVVKRSKKTKEKLPAKTAAAAAKPPQLVEPSPAATKRPVANPYLKIASVPEAEKHHPPAPQDAAAAKPVAIAINPKCPDCGLEIDHEDDHVCQAKAGAKVAEIPPPLDPQDMSPDDEINAANKLILLDDCSSLEDLKYLEATVHTPSHEKRRQVILSKFIQVIQANGNLFGNLSHMEKDPNGVFVPRLFFQLSGENPGMNKIRLCSNALWKFAKSLRNEKAGEGECPFLQPGTQNTYMKTLLGFMKQEYNWNYSITQDFNFAGGYFARAKTLYAERARDYPGYGSGGGAQTPNGSIESVQDIKLSSHFDEDNINEHQMKNMVVCGSCLGFRGRTEHTYLTRDNIVIDKFEAGSDFFGYEYIGVTNLTDKSHRIDPINDTARNTKNMMRLPIIDMNDPDDPGAIFKRLFDKMHPSQNRLYCKEATKNQKANFAMLGETIHMSPHQPLGVNKVAKMTKEAGERTGLLTSGHGFRRLFITTLVNAPGVSTEEVLGSARHRSVAASRNYMQRNHRSEANKLAALGITKKKADDSAQERA
mmetsp:Transcript_4578/g.7743  ORF Transcript_4578/g.7743 Transcript_4578/m.7743 type:complete len:550 (+) Transcript_4578:127-1776(+)